MRHIIVLGLSVLMLVAVPVRAEMQSSLEEHDGCVDEVRALVRFGEQAIEPFLPTQEGQRSFAAVQELISFTKGSVLQLQQECVRYQDLNRMMLLLTLIWETYQRMAEGSLQEYSTFVHIDQEAKEG